MRKIITCSIFICLFAVNFQAQMKTIRGDYCGQNSGNRAGAFGFRVGSRVVVLQMNFGQSGGNARMIRFNINRLKVGDEFVIKYNSDEFIEVITGTGKKKKIEPCTID